jgi:hypothetical protein
MELTGKSFVEVVGSTVHVRANSTSEAKIALKELKLKKKECSLFKREINEKQKVIRASYTDEVRTRGSMLRGGGGLGKFVRLFQTVSRDDKRSQLAIALAPLEQEKQSVESVIHAIDSAIIQVEAYILKN